MFSEDLFFNNLWLDVQRIECMNKKPDEIYRLLDQICFLGDIQKQKLFLFMKLWFEIKLGSEIKKDLRWIVRETAAPKKWLCFAENLYKNKVSCHNLRVTEIKYLVLQLTEIY